MLAPLSLLTVKPVLYAANVSDAELSGEEGPHLRGLREAVNILEDTPGPELGEAYAELSDVLSRRGLAEEALGYARRAFELSRR